jgi:hypothetical protein
VVDAPVILARGPLDRIVGEREGAFVVVSTIVFDGPSFTPTIRRQAYDTKWSPRQVMEALGHA